MEKTPTPHNSAKKGDFAKVVLMCGDPLRAIFIAEHFLENAKLVNNVRGIQGYTGEYKGKKISVMAHGMGNPSMGIYSYELFNYYDVDLIIRVGSIGAMQESIKLKDIIICEKTLTNTNYDNFYINHGRAFVETSPEIVNKVVQKAKDLKFNFHVGSTLCSDTFYKDELKKDLMQKYQLLGVEMECAALYLNAKKANKKAVAICTVSDSLVTKEKLDSTERAIGFSDMIKLALEVGYDF